MYCNFFKLLQDQIPWISLWCTAMKTSQRWSAKQIGAQRKSGVNLRDRVPQHIAHTVRDPAWSWIKLQKHRWWQVHDPYLVCKHLTNYPSHILPTNSRRSRQGKPHLNLHLSIHVHQWINEHVDQAPIVEGTLRSCQGTSHAFQRVYCWDGLGLGRKRGTLKCTTSQNGHENSMKTMQAKNLTPAKGTRAASDVSTSDILCHLMSFI